MALFRKLTEKIPVDQSTWSLVKRGVRDYTRQHVAKILAALGLMGIASAAVSGFPLFAKDIFDSAMKGEAVSTFVIMLAALLILLLVRGLSNLGQEAIMSWVGNRIIADIQGDMYAHVIRADLAYFHNNPTGGLISNFINDTNKMRTVFSDTITALGRDVLTLIFLVAVMFWQDWLLACMVFFVFPLAAIPVERLGRRMRKVSSTTQEEMAQFTTVLDESFQGARHVKAYGMEEHETSRAKGVIHRLFRLNFRASLVRAAADPILEVVAGIAVIILLAYSAYMVNEGGKTPGNYFAFIVAFLFAYEPVRKLSRIWSKLQEGLAAAERIFRTLDMRPEITEKPDAKPLEVGKGEIRLDDVHFAYHKDAPALKGLTLEAPPGKTVALVGPSGAGKSTVLNLIPRFYDVGDGAVTIDGTDVRDVTFRSLRGAIALVSQETSLFDDTIRANIAYGRPGATEEDIVAAAKAAAAHDFIVRLPDGYDTVAGGLGVKLSGGQRQRISIARAILKDAPILLLDEATSALDAKSEQQVQRALSKLMKDRTVLVIAHRLSTVVDADIIYVLEDGRAVESGRHADLLKKGGAYARLYATQLSPNGEAAPLPGTAEPEAAVAAKPS